MSSQLWDEPSAAWAFPGPAGTGGRTAGERRREAGAGDPQVRAAVPPPQTVPWSRTPVPPRRAAAVDALAETVVLSPVIAGDEAGTPGRHAGARRAATGRTSSWRSRRYTTRAFVAAAYAGLAAALWLWWRNVPAGSLHGFADRLDAASRITGLVGGYALALQLVVMSRLDWLERRVGTDRLIRWHRSLGGYTVTVLLGHLVATTWATMALARANPWASTLSMVRTEPDVLAAYVALGLLVLVAVSSIRRLRSRLAYETWYYLHLYTYLALALGFSHQFADGEDFTSSLSARVLWSALYLGAAWAIFYGRLVVPLRRAMRHRLRVTAVVPEGDDVVSIHLTGRRIGQLAAAPGQFFRWRFLTRDGWWQAHPFSLSAAPDPNGLRITVKMVGDHTRNLARLRPGTRVLAEGPYGSFIADHCRSGRMLMVAGGIGVAPVRALLDAVGRRGPHQQAPPVLIYRVRSERELVFREELERIAAAGRARIHFVIGRRGDRGPAEALSAAGLARLVPDIAERDLYVCGPPGLVHAVRRAARRNGLPPSRMHLDPFEF